MAQRSITFCIYPRSESPKITPSVVKVCLYPLESGFNRAKWNLLCRI